MGRCTMHAHSASCTGETPYDLGDILDAGSRSELVSQLELGKPVGQLRCRVLERIPGKKSAVVASGVEVGEPVIAGLRWQSLTRIPDEVFQFRSHLVGDEARGDYVAGQLLLRTKEVS